MIDVEAAGLTDAGPRQETNEDAIGAHEPDDPELRRRKGALFALADGMGGDAAGEAVGATAIRALIEEYYAPSSSSRVERALGQAVQSAHLQILDLAQRHGAHRTVSTTLSALVLAGVQAYVAHVGDSRVYHWRAGRLTQLTSDHSEAAELVRMRVIQREELGGHPGRNVLTRSLGGRLILRPDFFRQAVEPEDRFLICCDGLWSQLSEEEMAIVLARCRPAVACRALLDLALSREGTDNVSVQIIRVKSVTALPEEAPAQAGWLSGIRQRLGRG